MKSLTSLKWNFNQLMSRGNSCTLDNKFNYSLSKHVKYLRALTADWVLQLSPNYLVMFQPNKDQNWTVSFSQNQLAGCNHHRRKSAKRKKRILIKNFSGLLLTKNFTLSNHISFQFHIIICISIRRKKRTMLGIKGCAISWMVRLSYENSIYIFFHLECFFCELLGWQQKYDQD